MRNVKWMTKNTTSEKPFGIIDIKTEHILLRGSSMTHQPSPDVCICIFTKRIDKNVHSNTLCNSLKLETTWMSINGRMNTEIVVYLYNIILLQ